MTNKNQCECNDRGRGQYHLPGCALYVPFRGNPAADGAAAAGYDDRMRASNLVGKESAPLVNDTQPYVEVVSAMRPIRSLADELIHRLTWLHHGSPMKGQDTPEYRHAEIGECLKLARRLREEMK